MAAGDRFTEVTLDDMNRFLKRAYRALKPEKGESRGEVYYDLNLSDGNILVRVWTSIRPHSGAGAGLGEDAIRVTMITSKGKPLMPKGKIVMRTKNWKNALQDRIEDLLEVYESKAEYWKEQRQHRDEGTTREVVPKPPGKAGDLIEGGWGSLPSGGWGAQVPVGAQPGDQAMISTKGGKRTRVVLVEKVKSTRFGDLWTTENAKMAGEEAVSDGGNVIDMTRTVAARYLERLV